MPLSSQSVTHTRSTVLTIDSKRSSSKAETSDIVSTVTRGFRLSILDLAASSLCASPGPVNHHRIPAFIGILLLSDQHLLL